MTDLVDEVLNRLDIVSLTGIDKRGPHPIHGSESGINLSVNSTENNWFCFRHNVGGYAIHWIAIRDFGQTCDQAVQFVRNNFLTVVRRAFEIEGVEYSKKKIGQLPIREKKRYEVVDPDSYQFTFLKLRGKSKKKPGFPSTWSDYHETMYGIDLSTKQNRIILTGSFNLELYPLLIMDFDLVKGSEEIFNIDAFLGATKFQHSFMVKTPSRGVHVYYLLEKVDSFDDIPKSYTIEITDKMRKAYPYLQGLRQIDVQSKGKGAFAPPTEWTEGEVLGKYEVVGHHWLKVMNPDFLKKLEFAEVLDPGAVRSISQEPTRQKPLTAREVMNGVQQFLEDLRDEYPQFKVKNFDEVIYFDKSRGIHVIDEEDRFLNRRVAKFLKQHHQFQDLDTNHINEIVKKHKKSLLTGKIMDLDNFFKRSKFINPSTIVYCTETCIIKQNIKNGKIEPLPHNSDDLFISKLQFTFIEKPDPTYWLERLSEAIPNTQDLELVLLQFAYSLIPDFSWKTSLLLQGPTNSGKTTLINNFVKVFPRVVRTKLSNLQKDLFAYQELLHADIWVINEIDNKYFETETWKNVIEGTEISIRRMYKGSIEKRVDFKVFHLANHLPKIKDEATSFRLLPVKTPRRFDRDKTNEIEKKLQENLHGFVSWLIINKVPEYFKRLRELTELQKSRTFDYYAENEDPWQKFVDDMISPHGDPDDVLSYTSQDISDVQNDWALLNGHDRLSARQIGIKLGYALKNHEEPFQHLKKMRDSGNRYWTGIKLRNKRDNSVQKNLKSFE